MYVCYSFPALGEDFQILESYVVIPENFTTGIIDFSVDIVADDFVEGDHSFFVRLVNDGSFTLGTNSELEVIILDDDSEFKVQPSNVLPTYIDKYSTKSWLVHASTAVAIIIVLDHCIISMLQYVILTLR